MSRIRQPIVCLLASVRHVIIAFLAVAITGCLRTTSGLEGASAESRLPDGQAQYSKYVIINNTRLARGLQIVDLRSDYVGDLLRGTVSLVSKYPRTLKAQYSFSWYDATGREIQPGTEPWTPLVLYGNESKTIVAVAPTSEAREFRVRFRP